MQIEPFSIKFKRAAISDLQNRIRNTRWPRAAPGNPWQLGMDDFYLKSLLSYWGEEFDWQQAEGYLNQFDHFLTDLGGIKIHFVHQRALNGHGIPIILTHGWPSNFVEYIPLIKFLTDPAAHGIDGPSFDVVVPSLPGCGFSQRPAHIETRETAVLWHDLMVALGYTHYGAHGTDFGAGVSTFMALRQSDAVLGLHLSNIENSPHIGPDSPILSEEELAYECQGDAWFLEEGGYKAIQRTRPQTLAFGLSDSPAGLAAWVLEKWRAWSDSSGDLTETFDQDYLLTMLSIFWTTNSISTSIRDYVDNRHSGYSLTAGEYVSVPTAVAGFSHMLVGDDLPPRAWVERMYNIMRWTPMASGGHFAAAEKPRVLADDIASFFLQLEYTGTGRLQV